MIVNRIVKLLFLLLCYLEQPILFVGKSAKSAISLMVLLKLSQLDYIVTFSLHYRPELFLL